MKAVVVLACGLSLAVSACGGGNAKTNKENPTVIIVDSPAADARGEQTGQPISLDIVNVKSGAVTLN